MHGEYCTEWFYKGATTIKQPYWAPATLEVHLSNHFDLLKFLLRFD